MLNTIEEAVKDLQAGKVIILVDDESRENEGDFVCLAEHATPENINFMATHGRGLICTPVSPDIALRLKLDQMVSHNTDHHETAFTVSIDHKDAKTGISAFERSDTILQMLNTKAVPQDFKRPGHVFPLVAKSGGVFQRQGHTEASVDLARLSGSEPAAVICEIMNPDGSMSRMPELEKLADDFDLKLITIEDLYAYRAEKDPLINRESSVHMPTDFGEFRMVGYSNRLDTEEHVAIVKGDPAAEEAPIVRIHSECLTGDIFHSRRCDCGAQLTKSLELIEQAGAGIVLYMRQEGRGIGLLNKLKAYELQEQGLDTVEANEQLGFPAEMRDYTLCALMLKDLGVSRVRLLTNNPAKTDALIEYGIEVEERLALVIPPTEDNTQYMKTKKQRMHHLID
ncbi:bifunctional 3,4-dihydroxy-2-butanone 4-phosphate synthase/GTP cyclohydrolase II [Planococcus plakortidis]|uniref:Riboflavin biosynthesis protein RibBA n=1 Tax=Planococcus plakortidis TaxID=1038856 RepID=A0A1C7EBU3_9BACL|nr:bifunctional 3,4-dihydroxy-2-butanone-4-phosphate synthase/GTP cyclohydrolase II [Planococcus plakortidis]ANU21208.1 bifunctional 3,4-dihydroxy-2-butanone 4-phosphate synthase/GTP cyclohydrolase II [Planococcus plakortidis]